MIRALTWNIGSFDPIKYIKNWGIKYKGQKITHQYFQPVLNGDFVSKNVVKINPDIIFLQEFYFSEDVESIKVLKNYPHKKLIDTWYHKHSILIASKREFLVSQKDNFAIVSYDDFNFVFWSRLR